VGQKKKKCIVIALGYPRSTSGDVGLGLESGWLY